MEFRSVAEQSPESFDDTDCWVAAKLCCCGSTAVYSKYYYQSRI
jgi:hypothetical protein